MTTNLSWSSSKGTYSANPLTTVLGSEKEDQVGTLLIGTLLIGTLLIGTLLIETLLIGTLLIGTLRSFDAMATRTSKNEKKQKKPEKNATGLEGKTTTLHVHHTFFIHFLGVFCTTTTWNWPILHFMEDINKDNEILFLFLNFDRDPRRVQKHG